MKMLSLIVPCWKGWKTKVGPKQKYVKYRLPGPIERHRQLIKVSCYGNKRQTDFMTLGCVYILMKFSNLLSDLLEQGY